jgi:hypothetical protein
MVTSEDGKRSDATVRGDTPDGGRGLDIIGSLLTITGIRAISRGIARVCGGDAGDSPEPIEAFCLRCRVKTPMQKAETSVLANGSDSMQGYCSVCGTRMSRIMKRQ